MKSPTSSSIAAPAFQRTGMWLSCAVAGFLMLVLANQSVALTASALAVIGCLLLMLRWPETGTLVVLFAIYSNIGVLAMRSSTAIQATAGTPAQNPRIALVSAALLLLLCVPLVHRIFVCRQKLIFDRTFVLMLVFLAPLVASSMFARDRSIVFSELADYFFEGIVLYFLVSNSIRELATLKRAIWALLLAGCLMAGFSVFQKVTHTEHNIYGGLAQVWSDFRSNPRMPHLVERQARVTQGFSNGEVAGQLRGAGPIGETNRYGQILLVLLPLAALQFRTEQSRRLRVLALAAGGLVLGGLLLTLSRGNLLAAAVALALMAGLRLLKPGHVIGAVFGVAVLITVFAPGVASRMATLERVELLFGESRTARASDSSAVRRYVENVAAWRVFLDHPILGVGPGHFAAYYSNDYGNRVGLVEQTKNYRAHNLYLETLAETGLVGFAFFLLILASIIQGLWKERARLKDIDPQLACVATAFLISLSAYCVSAVFVHLSYQRYFWLLLAFATAAIRLLRAKSREIESALPHLRPREG